MAKEEGKQETIPTVGLTEEQLERLLTAAIRAGKEPTALEQEKINVERAKAQKLADTREKVAAAERERAQMVANRWCNHKQDLGRSDRSAISGQLHSDGKIHEYCVVCCREVRVRAPLPHEIGTV